MVEHEKRLVGVTLVLVVALIAQIKFCKARLEPDVNFARSPPSSQVNNPSSSIINVAGTWEMSVQKRSGTLSWTLKLEQHGEQLTGVINSEGGDLPVTGTVHALQNRVLDFPIAPGESGDGFDKVQRFDGLGDVHLKARIVDARSVFETRVGRERDG